MKVLICEDHEIFRDGIRKDIEKGLQGPHIIDEAVNGDEALHFLKKEQYDVVLMDIKLPGKTGLDLLQIIKITWPNQIVLMLSNYDESDYAYKALLYGASGYLNKAVSSRELIFFMQKALRGGLCFSPEIEQMAIEAKKIKKKHHIEYKHELLTDRQFMLLKMFGEGKSNKIIAKELHIGEKSISAHKHQIKKCMNFKDDNEMQSYYNNYILNQT
jgi:two-component system, NarL family, invasion response regulator UvrY